MDKKIERNETTPALGKKLTIRDLEHVSGGRAPAELKTKVSDGGWTSEGES